MAGAAFSEDFFNRSAILLEELGTEAGLHETYKENISSAMYGRGHAVPWWLASFCCNNSLNVSAEWPDNPGMQKLCNGAMYGCNQFLNAERSAATATVQLMWDPMAKEGEAWVSQARTFLKQRGPALGVRASRSTSTSRTR